MCLASLSKDNSLIAHSHPNLTHYPGANKLLNEQLKQFVFSWYHPRLATDVSLYMNKIISSIVWFWKDFYSHIFSESWRQISRILKYGFKKEISVENKWWRCLAVTPNGVLFIYANCWITYCGLVIILFMIFLSVLWGMYGWLWHTSPSLLKSQGPSSHLIIFSNDFGKCIRHSVLLWLILNSVFFSFFLSPPTPFLMT